MSKCCCSIGIFDVVVTQNFFPEYQTIFFSYGPVFEHHVSSLNCPLIVGRVPCEILVNQGND